MKESTIQALIRKAICNDGRAIVTRNNVGIAEYPGGAKVVYGLGDGSPDLVGMLTVGAHKGRVFCLEIKRDGRDNTAPKRRIKQMAWARVCRRRGGFCATVRSEVEAMAALGRALAGGSE